MSRIILRPIGSITIQTTPVSVVDFFRDDRKIGVAKTKFEKRLGLKLNVQRPGTALSTFQSFVVEEHDYDKNRRAVVLTRVTPEDIARLISRQLEGQPGFLSTTSPTHFNVQGYNDDGTRREGGWNMQVSIYWSTRQKKWLVDFKWVDAIHALAGDYVICPAE